MSKFTVPSARQLLTGALGAVALTFGMIVMPAAQSGASPAPMPQCGGLSIQASHDQFGMNLGGACNRYGGHQQWRPPNGPCCGGPVRAPREFQPVVMERWFAPQDGFHLAWTHHRGEVLVQNGPPGWRLIMRGDTLVYVEW